MDRSLLGLGQYRTFENLSLAAIASGKDFDKSDPLELKPLPCKNIQSGRAFFFFFFLACHCFGRQLKHVAFLVCM